MSQISDLAKTIGKIPAQLIQFCEIHEKTPKDCEAIFKQFVRQGFYREGANGWGEAPASVPTPGEPAPTTPPLPPADPAPAESTVAVTAKVFVNGVELPQD